MQKIISLVLASTVSALPFSAYAAECTDCTVPNFVGISTSNRLNDTSVMSITGKYKVPTNSIDLSLRPEVTLNNSGLIGGGAALTIDTKVPVGTLYSGVGVSLDQLFPTSNLKTYGVVGVESKINYLYNAFGTVKLPFSSDAGVYKPTFTVGLGYSF